MSESRNDVMQRFYCFAPISVFGDHCELRSKERVVAFDKMYDEVFRTYCLPGIDNHLPLGQRGPMSNYLNALYLPTINYLKTQ